MTFSVCLSHCDTQASEHRSLHRHLLLTDFVTLTKWFPARLADTLLLTKTQNVLLFFVSVRFGLCIVMYHQVLFSEEQEFLIRGKKFLLSENDPKHIILLNRDFTDDYTD